MAETKLLEYNQKDIPEGGVVLLRQWSGSIKAANKEPAGHIFHNFAKLQHFKEGTDGYAQSEAQDINKGDVKSSQNSKQNQSQEQKGKPKKTRKLKLKDGIDYYKLLGLQDIRWEASDKDIKDAWRRSALEQHPDKVVKSEHTEDHNQFLKLQAEDKFKLVQEAYETLADPALRKEYDSIDEFDDYLPSTCSAKDFYKVFGPAFRRNSRWSIVQPVPVLGDAKSPIDQVEKFYDFWYQLKSWREFPHPDEEDIEQAEFREHRRQIERFNQKLREKAKKEETKKYRNFINNAYNNDPRIQQKKEQVKIEREQKKQEKHNKKYQDQNAQNQKKLEDEQEQLKLMEEEKIYKQAEKEQKEKQKQQQKIQRQKLRQLTGTSQDAGLEPIYKSQLIDQIIQILSIDQLTDLNQDLELNTLDKIIQIRILDKILGIETEIDLKILQPVEEPLQEQKVQTQQQPQTQQAQNGVSKKQPKKQASQNKKQQNQQQLQQIQLQQQQQQQQQKEQQQQQQQQQSNGFTDTSKQGYSKEQRQQQNQQSQAKDQQELKIKNDNIIPQSNSPQGAQTGGVGVEYKSGQKQSDEWSVEELKVLDKALNKYPQGTPKRWEIISQMIQTRTTEDILKMVKERQGASSTLLKQQMDWKPQKVKGGKGQEVEATQRLDGKESQQDLSADQQASPADKINSIKKDLKVPSKNPLQKEVSSKHVQSDTSSNHLQADTVKKQAEGKVQPKVNGSTENNGIHSQAKALSSNDGETWSDAQDLQLVNALKLYPKEQAERWELVSKEVGKSKSSCQKRFKYIRNSYKQQVKQ